jgi:hypothetical protein
MLEVDLEGDGAPELVFLEGEKGGGYGEEVEVYYNNRHHGSFNWDGYFGEDLYDSTEEALEEAVIEFFDTDYAYDDEDDD